MSKRKHMSLPLARAKVEVKPEEPRLFTAQQMRDAFDEGFLAPRTYNDGLLNDADEEWPSSSAFETVTRETKKHEANHG